MKEYKEQIKKGHVNQITVTVLMLLMITGLFVLGLTMGEMGFGLDESSIVLAQ
jgi:hypothetical protein